MIESYVIFPIIKHSARTTILICMYRGEASVGASGDVPSTVIMDTPGGEDDEVGMDDDNMFVVADSTALTAPNAAFNSNRNVDDKPEGKYIKCRI